ncbi:MAG: hypothetical protein PHP00_02120 [Thiotrichaceae bacterium]|nr:hypothetical protein [Thiotrichaceae bacterium]
MIPNRFYSVKQPPDEWRYQASYQVQQASLSKTYTATLSTKAEEVDNNLTELAAVGGTITPAAADFFGICAGTSLTPAATDVFTGGTLAFDPVGGIWGGGVLKFSSGNKFIMNGNSSLASIALNISSMTTGDTITISANAVTFSSVTGGSLSCGGTAYTAGNAITTGTICTVTVVAAPPAVSAPLDFDFNKPAKVFATEVKVK